MNRVANARSALFVPGDRPERFAKASSSGADVVVIDLEDGVAPDRKIPAREHVLSWLQQGGRALVRVNGVGTDYFSADHQALAGMPGVVGVVVPMADDPDALRHLGATLGADVPILPQIETARGLDRASELAAVSGVARLTLGHLDLAADLGCEPGREALLFARSTIVVASRLAGLPGPVESVTTTLDNPTTCADDAAYAKRLGFTGKFAIHPSQISPINTTFGPTEDELAWAVKVLKVGAGGGAVRHDGEMIDGPVISRARAILSRAGGSD
ncbi:HpcH/HpaI aldolase/citrate lyase family protein [Terrabacter terrigena]|uniref:HpcH/HpaI aldolase/citrate lyase family protein n=1 Tax=Terrabacter terrigena TaxID=574718 RepID=A0ABW3MYZ5_9MICO